jgi:excisionase family DNA binding protein
MERLLSIDELKEFLGVKKATIYSWTSQNKIPHVKLSKRLVKFREKEIMAWIATKSIITGATETDQNAGKRSSYKKQSPGFINNYIDRVIKRAKEEVIK